MYNSIFKTRCGPTDRPTDQLTDRQTDIVTYRAAIAAKNYKLSFKVYSSSSSSFIDSKVHKCNKLQTIRFQLSSMHGKYKQLQLQGHPERRLPK